MASFFVFLEAPGIFEGGDSTSSYFDVLRGAQSLSEIAAKKGVVVAEYDRVGTWETNCTHDKACFMTSSHVMIRSHYSAAKPRPVCNGTLSRRIRRSKGVDERRPTHAVRQPAPPLRGEGKGSEREESTTCFHLAFVDGNHRFDGVFLDLVFLGRLVRAGGIIFVDDYQLPAVARAVSFCVTNLNWTIEEVSAADYLHRWAVLRTSAKADTRPFDYYVEF